MNDYQVFLQSKARVFKGDGIEVEPHELHEMLYPFQRDLTSWALRKGRAAIFADCGLGKTLMEIAWAQWIPGPVLILAPLAVAQQTVAIGAMMQVPITYTRSQETADLVGITISNYEMVTKFDPSAFAGIIIDESSILKAQDGKTKQLLIDMFQNTPYRLACTATPAPNDMEEFANHAEFLGIMTRPEMLATFFVHDDKGYRLKGHARSAFFRWLASWGMSLSKPSDLNYSDDGYILPELHIHQRVVSTDYVPEGQLFATGLKGITDRTKVRHGTIDRRVEEAVQLITAEPTEQWIAWCGLNIESKAITAALPDAIEVEGSQLPDEKTERIQAFLRGEKRVLVTKGKIAGFGLNLQNAARQVFVGINDSQELHYQCLRRSWRFGQTKPVHAYIVVSELETAIYENVLRKEREAKMAQDELIANASQYERSEISSTREQDVYQQDTASGQGWQMLLGDSVERLKELDEASVDLSVHSPPFASLYTYSNSDRDLGNAKSDTEFLEHYAFVIRELLRVTKVGRVACVHVFDIPAMLTRDGYIGLKDFSGDVIRLYIACGWVFDSRIPIDKNQQAQSIRTHAKGLTMTQMEKDRTWSRPALPDYILKFRKPGENMTPVRDGGVTRDEWIEFANPSWPDTADRCADAGAMATWYGIRETDTLNVQLARERDDEKHICPIQLETVERCIRLWTNPGELVLDPFSGIGSVGVEALRVGRRFVGVELKQSYWKVAVRNLGKEQLQGQLGLFEEAISAGVPPR